MTWAPWDETPVMESVLVGGVELRAGSQVRLVPHGRADIMDMALAGKIATVESIQQSFEDEIQLAVTIDEDPGKDLGVMRMIGHRFFFKLAEVEPLGG